MHRFIALSQCYIKKLTKLFLRKNSAKLKLGQIRGKVFTRNGNDSLVLITYDVTLLKKKICREKKKIIKEKRYLSRSCAQRERCGLITYFYLAGIAYVLDFIMFGGTRKKYRLKHTQYYQSSRDYGLF